MRRRKVLERELRELGAHHRDCELAGEAMAAAIRAWDAVGPLTLELAESLKRWDDHQWPSDVMQAPTTAERTDRLRRALQRDAGLSPVPLIAALEAETAQGGCLSTAGGGVHRPFVTALVSLLYVRDPAGVMDWLWGRQGGGVGENAPAERPPHGGASA